MIVPLGFQAPGFLEEAPQTVDTEPLEISIFLSSFPAMKARKRLSGDQKRVEAPSVPARGRDTGEPIGRTHTSARPSVAARKATTVPSGETAGAAGIKVVVSGAGTVKRTVCTGAERSRLRTFARSSTMSATTSYAGLHAPSQ